MFAVEYIESADPVFRFLQEQRHNLLGRHYAGYMLFFFGAADQEIATWFANNLMALDSLTGNSLAGIVFAEKVRLRIQRVHKEEPGGRLPTEEERRQPKNVVPLDNVRSMTYWPSDDPRITERDGIRVLRLGRTGRLQTRYPEEEVSAITYASDELARRFNVVGDLPCIVLLDCVPTGTVEIIELAKSDPQDIMHLLRQLVGQFTNQVRYTPYFDLMNSVSKVSREIATVMHLIEDLLAKLPAINVMQSPQVWELNAKNAFMKGDYKRVRKIIWEESHVSEERSAPILRQLKQCKFARRENGGILPKPAEERFLRYLPNADRDIDRLSDLRAERKCELEEEIRKSEERVTELELEKTGLQQSIKDVDVPSLQKVFRKIVSGSAISSRTHQAGTTIREWFTESLKPETIIKIAEFVGRH